MRAQERELVPVAALEDDLPSHDAEEPATPQAERMDLIDGKVIGLLGG